MAPVLPIYLIHWRQPEWCASAARSILASASVEPAITVIDNGNEPSVDLRNLLPEQVRLLTMQTNVGYSGGANIALENCRTRFPENEFCVVGSHDLHVESHAFEKLLNVAERHPEYGILGPVLTAPFESSGGKWRGNKGGQLPIPVSSSGLVERDWVSGTCLFLRLKCAEEIGGFDERFGSYVEDLDLCLRARDLGWRVGVVIEARARGMGTGDAVASSNTQANVIRLVRRRQGRLQAFPVLTRILADVAQTGAAGLAPWRGSGRRALSRKHLLLHIRSLKAGVSTFTERLPRTPPADAKRRRWQSKTKRIAYLQYTNPAGYPPLLHSARELSRHGWSVLVLGTDAVGTRGMHFPVDEVIDVRQLGYVAGGWRQKAHYLWFVIWSLGWALRRRPKWVYASDPLATPAALLLSKIPGTKVVYHEHDSPPRTIQSSVALRTALAARKRIARSAEICILPNEHRAKRFEDELGTRPLVVWNCVSLEDVVPPVPTPRANERTLLWYHGSFAPNLIPSTVIEALAMLPDLVHLHTAGYETIGNEGYIDALQLRAEHRGIGHRFHHLGALPRVALLREARKAHIGLCLLLEDPADVNHAGMVGASNKPFDYLASGLGLIVPNSTLWLETFVEPGLALACEPDRPESIAAAIERFLAEHDLRTSMVAAGQKRIFEEWNYETQFRPVLKTLERS